jgi:hypothetical protein
VKYTNVYPRIDIVCYLNQRWLECNFLVAPGEDPRATLLALDGDEKLRVDAGTMHLWEQKAVDSACIGLSSITWI